MIEARRTEGPSERFVITYPDEESLRELIAGPSIIACGFASREEAQANIDADFWTARLGSKLQEDLQSTELRNMNAVLSAKRRLGAGFNVTQTGRIVHGFLHAAVAGAIVIFYSRNAVSTLIRSSVGG